MDNYNDFLTQLGVLPPGGYAPPVQPQGFLPYDTSAVPPTGLPPMDTGITDLGGVPAAAATYGYNPQPRPALPAQLGDEGANAALFGGYRDRYQPPAPEQDPIAALLGTDRTAGMAGFPQTPPPSRALAPDWTGQRQQAQYGANAQQQPLSENERNLLRQSPAYGRAIARFRDLDARRARMGM